VVTADSVNSRMEVEAAVVVMEVLPVEVGDTEEAAAMEGDKQPSATLSARIR